jgi:hypothetical protein
MKIVILSGIFLLLFANISAQKTITCKKETFEGHPACIFRGVTIGPNEAVTIKTNPANLVVNSITAVSFESSSIHSVPSEVFTKFPNLKVFTAWNVKLQEVKPNAFEKGRKLEDIRLNYNELTFLHLDTFKGEHFNFLLFLLRNAKLRKFISKGLTELKRIWLNNNKLSAMHPRMFSHLTKLNELYLSGNTCIDKRFNPVTSLAAVEQELATCGSNYPVFLPDLSNVQYLLKRHESKFESIENQLKIMNGKSEEREKKVDRKFELLTELFYNVDGRNDENAAEIKEIKKMVEKIWDMLNTK